MMLLSDHDVLNQKRLTQSIIQRWLHEMIDAGWNFVFDDDKMFVHADEHTSINHIYARKLVEVYWHTLKIPTPYNVNEIAELQLASYKKPTYPARPMKALAGDS